MLLSNGTLAGRVSVGRSRRLEAKLEVLSVANVYSDPDMMYEPDRHQLVCIELDWEKRNSLS